MRCEIQNERSIQDGGLFLVQANLVFIEKKNKKKKI
jgi:hypothetical protein